MSRLAICAAYEYAALISRQRNNDHLTTGTAAAEDRSEVVVCLWGKFSTSLQLGFPPFCHLGQNCCLVDDRYWDKNETPSADKSERLFS